MGKDWDKAVPSVDIWKECLRVLKPGAFAFVMSGPRMDCLSEMGKRLGEAGFEIAFSPLFWAYASGFNKSADMTKLIDKRECRRQLKEKLGRNLTKEEIRDAWAGFREVVIGKTSHYQTGKGHSMMGNVDESWPEPYQKGDAAKGRDVLAPATPEAAALDGSYAGFQPKPAVEVVIVAMKPLEHNTYIDQALDNRKGISWLDDCRIPFEQCDDIHAKNPHTLAKGSAAYDGTCYGEYGSSSYSVPPGRFPANLLVQDDVVDDGQVLTSGSGNKNTANRDVYHGGLGKGYGHGVGGDSGSFSRYFSLDAWWQSKLSELPESVQRTFPFLIVPKAGKKEKNLGCEGLPEQDGGAYAGGVGLPGRTYKDGEWVQTGTWNEPNRLPRRNAHPTVKPLKLMSYLITLGSRPGDLVLDPFAGTCTTGMAAKMLGRDYLMVEIDEEWCRIGQRRVDAIQASLL